MALSLAEHLGVVDIRHPEVPATAAAAAPLTAKQFCLAVLESPEFRSYIADGIVLRNLPAPVILRVMDQGWGKPVEQVEVKDTTNRLEAWSAEQLEERALFLAETARRLRQEQAVEGSVH